MDSKSSFNVRALQTRFSQAKCHYETFVLAQGYWFDRWLARSNHPPSHYELKQALELLYGLERALEERADDAEWARELAAAFYQRALVHCELGDFVNASTDLQRLNQQLQKVPAGTWMSNEKQAFDSQRFFLEGEMAIVGSNRAAARTLLQQAYAIDRSRGDQQGVAEIQERLAMC